MYRVGCLLEGQGGARNVDPLFAAIDTQAESVEGSNERGEVLLGALYDYAERS